MRTLQPLRHTVAGVLDVAWYGCGPEQGPPVFLMHGFPYDIHAYAQVAPRLAAAGCRAIVPYLRGFGSTRFLDAATPRSGEQAALGADLLALMDALQVPRAVLAGYDWGGRAACVVAALWPQRCAGLVSYNSYNIHDIAETTSFEEIAYLVLEGTLPNKAELAAFDHALGSLPVPEHLGFAVFDASPGRDAQ